MNQLGDWTRWSFLIFVVVLSPVVLILGVPAAIGLGIDAFELAGERTILALLCAPLVLGLLWRFGIPGILRRAIARLWSRLHLEQAAHLIHAP